MREHARPQPGDRPRSAASPARAETPAAHALALQGAVGNRAASRLLQRVDVKDMIAGAGTMGLWLSFVRWARMGASRHLIDPGWRKLAAEYSATHAIDGDVIRKGFNRKPTYWVGGPLFEVVDDGTHAITLDDEVFFNPRARWSVVRHGCDSYVYECDKESNALREPLLDTWVHELVHVAQFKEHGVGGFLGTYVAQLVTKALEGKLSGEDLDIFHEAGFEKQAYGIEDRFMKWRREKEKREEAERKRPAQEPKKPRPTPLEEFETQRKLERPTGPGHGVRLAIGKSVGAGGRNDPTDVEVVSARLKKLGYLDSDSPSVAVLTAAIKRYQTEVFAWRRPDGLIEPGGKTHVALEEGRKKSELALPS